jgi:hypothetical protein
MKMAGPGLQPEGMGGCRRGGTELNAFPRLIRRLWRRVTSTGERKREHWIVPDDLQTTVITRRKEEQMETKRQTIGEFIHAFLRRHYRERGPVCEFDFTDEECRRLGIYFVTALGEWSTGRRMAIISRSGRAGSQISAGGGEGRGSTGGSFSERV